MSPPRKLLWLGCVLATLLAMVSAASPGGFRRYVSLRKDAAALEEQKAHLKAENERLVREIAALREDPQALERAAREELNFVKPGEIILNLE